MDNGWVQNTETLERMKLEEAATNGLIEVNYQGGNSEKEPEMLNTKQYAVYAVEDRAAARRVNFKQAIDSGVEIIHLFI